MEMTQGTFITFEGIEGCGKTTQLRLLAQHLTQVGITHRLTKEPGGSSIGADIRKILLHKDSTHMVPACEALLYLADRAQHHSEIIRPALRAGTWVICDRYQDSTLAYQGAARGLPADELNHIFALVTGNLKPHFTILLDLDPLVGLARAKARLEDHGMASEEGRFEDEALVFHQAVRKAFLNLAREETDRFLVIDADRPPPLIAEDITANLTKRGCLV